MMGIVMLVYDGRIIASNYYSCRARRNEVVEKWRKWYGKRVYKCYIHILPDAKEGVADNGMNIERRGRKRIVKRKKIGLGYYKLRA